MVNEPLKFEKTFYTSPKLAAIVMTALGTAIVVVADVRFQLLYRQKMLIFAVALFAVSGLIWVLEDWRPQLGRSFTVMAVVALIFWGVVWLAVPEFLILASLPVALTIGILGFRAALLTALSSTLLCCLLPYYSPGTVINTASFVLTPISIWGTFILVYFAFRPLNQIAGWSWEHFRQAQRSLEEARDRKVELEQALNALAQAHREQALFTERLAAMRRLAEAAQQAKAAFVARVSHEFRTPLNMIIGLVDTLVETAGPQYHLPAGVIRDLEIVHRNSNHLASLVNDVLDLSQTETGQLQLDLEWADLREDIHSALAVIRPLLEKKKLIYKTLLPADLPLVYYDRVRIRQVLLNLISNAARFTPAGGVTIQAEQQGRQVMVKVIDTGPGIIPEHAEKIFEPFYQSISGSRSEHGGSGLGLSISLQLIELHGGQIGLESEPGRGSTFFFSLPIAPPAPLSVEPKSLVREDWLWYERADWPKLPVLPYQQRVVICDETGALHPLLGRYPHLEFIDAVSLPQAVQVLQDRSAHVMILNAAAPERLEPLLAQAMQNLPDTPIVGCCLPSQLEAALAAGAVDYLTKPVRQADLKTLLEAMETPIARIVVADDNPDVQELFTKLLHAVDEGLEVTAVAGGEACLAALGHQRPDLVLLDVLMPDLDGWQVLATIRQNEALKEIPVVMISGEDLVKQPQRSAAVQVAISRGISLNKLLAGSLQLSALLLEPD